MKDELEDIAAAIEPPATLPSRTVPYSDLPPRDVDALVIKLRQALAGASLERSAGRANAMDAGSVVVTCLGTLAELLQAAPIEKRPKIEALIKKYAN